MDNNANKSQDTVTSPVSNNMTSPENGQLGNETLTSTPLEQSATKAQIDETQLPNQTSAFNGEEKVIYQIKPEKDANPFGVIVFFAIIIGFAVNLPTISSYVNKYINKYFLPAQIVPPSPKPTDEDDDTKTEPNESPFYSFNLGYDSATIDNLSIKNPNMSQEDGHYILNFTLINDSENNYNFDKKYYIEFYDNDSYISDSLIQSFDILAAKQSREFSVVISEKAYKKANQFKLVEKSIADYPKKEIIDTEGEYKLLKCTLDNDKITYYFKNDLLVKIENSYGNELSDSNYDTLLNQAREYSSKLKEIDGIDSTLVESIDGYSITNIFDMKTIQSNKLTSLKQYKLFRYNEKSKVVAYEITSLGYTCS